MLHRIVDSIGVLPRESLVTDCTTVDVKSREVYCL